MPSNYFKTFGVEVLSSATVAITEGAHLGVRLMLHRAAGVAATLPPATGSGNRYEFIVRTSVTSNQYRIDAAGTDKISGLAHVLGSAAALFAANGAANNRIDMNGSTTGGLLGSRVVIDDVAPGLWSAVVEAAGSGTAATPFATRA
jgi:hypothetical protein